VILVTVRDVGVEDKAAIEAEAEVVIEVVLIGPITATSMVPDGRHRARPALALILLTTLAILVLSDLILQVPLNHRISTTAADQISTDFHHPLVIGTPILPHPTIETLLDSTETSQPMVLLLKGKELEVPPLADGVVLCLRDQTSHNTEKEGTEALHIGSVAAETKAAVLLDEVGSAVEKTAANLHSPGRVDLGHRATSEGSILHLTDDPVRLVVTTTVITTPTMAMTAVTTDLTIGQPRDILFNHILSSPQPLTPQGAIQQ
jgi:hypothetical protein